MKRVIIFSLCVVCLFSSQAQEEYCDTLKWKSLKTDCVGRDGGSFYRIGTLNGSVINIDTLPIFYTEYVGVNISNDTFFAGESVSIESFCSIYTDTVMTGNFGWKVSNYYFPNDFYPNDTMRLVVSIKYDLLSMIDLLKEYIGIEFEQISYWQTIIGVGRTSKDGDYSDSVFFAGADTSIFYVVRGGVGIAETHCNASLQVYPNPVNYELRIMNYEGENIEIYDITGKTITNFQFSTFNSQLSIDVSHLASGMYFLRVGEKTTKFVKE